MKTTSYDFATNPLTETDQQRFWAKVQKTNTCWLWVGACMMNGYGLLTIHGKNMLAHRMAYYLINGVMTEKYLCHSCDVRNCVNPAHLTPGTQHDNMKNIYQSGRKWHGKPSDEQKVQRTCLNCSSIFMRTVTIHRKELEPLCSPNCRKEWNRRDIAEQFWSHVDRSNPDSCWNWQGRLHRNGYGQIGFRSRDRLAHRFAWRLVYGNIPPGLHILHSCDNPSCVNPTHLSIGTRSENMQDASRKGRTYAPMRGLKGELNPFSKLTNLQRQEIRDRHAQGESYGMLAKAYGLGKTTIARIIKS